MGGDASLALDLNLAPILETIPLAKQRPDDHGDLDHASHTMGLHAPCSVDNVATEFVYKFTY